MIHRLFTEPLSAKNSVALDLSATNLELNPSIYGNVSAFQEYIEGKLGGKMGFGGYLEHRVIYESYENFATASADFRNIHLGMDFWTQAGTTYFCSIRWRGAQFSGESGGRKLWPNDHFISSYLKKFIVYMDMSPWPI